MSSPIERALDASPDPVLFGQLSIRRASHAFVITHRADTMVESLRVLRSVEEASELSRYDQDGRYRPLKTAPNLQRGWRLELNSFDEVERALDYLYPGRIAIFAAWKSGRLRTTALRETLGRQSGMYRVAAAIRDQDLDDVVANVCRSDTGCVRTILWQRDGSNTAPSAKLPPDKFDAGFDQAGNEQPAQILVPLLCQEACSILVNECRRVAKARAPEGSGAGD